MTRGDALNIVRRAICTHLNCSDANMDYGTMLESSLGMTTDDIERVFTLLHTTYAIPLLENGFANYRSISAICNYVAYQPQPSQWIPLAREPRAYSPVW